MSRPRILLVPSLTELEWLIKPQLEEWADVASFDAPGVGDEPRPVRFERGAVIDRALGELDLAGWDSCFIACDSHGIPTGVGAAMAWSGQVLGMALGHARLSDRTQGNRAPVNKAVWDAMGQLLKNDYSSFVRYGLTQLTQGSIGDELAQRMLERVPMDVAQTAFENMQQTTDSIEEPLKALDVPLLFVKHEGCIGATEEGWEDAVGAFPEARTHSVPEAPTVSAEFAEALRSFCLEIAASASSIPQSERGPA
jgi:hypothetical protein